MTTHAEDKQAVVDEQLWTIEQLSDFLQIPVKSIRHWRETGEGPRGYRIGKHVRFRRSDVLAWLETRLGRFRSSCRRSTLSIMTAREWWRYTAITLPLFVALLLAGNALIPGGEIRDWTWLIGAGVLADQVGRRILALTGRRSRSS